MIDLEKVIKGLECCEASEILACESCPYREGHDLDLICFDTLQADALETLKWEKIRINRLKKILDIVLKERRDFVRCKDCEYCEYPNSEKEWCIKGHLHGNAETWFCADGKRKEEHDDQSIGSDS